MATTQMLDFHRPTFDLFADAAARVAIFEKPLRPVFLGQTIFNRRRVCQLLPAVGTAWTALGHHSKKDQPSGFVNGLDGFHCVAGASPPDVSSRAYSADREVFCADRCE